MTELTPLAADLIGEYPVVKTYKSRFISFLLDRVLYVPMIVSLFYVTFVSNAPTWVVNISQFSAWFILTLEFFSFLIVILFVVMIVILSIIVFVEGQATNIQRKENFEVLAEMYQRYYNISVYKHINRWVFNVIILSALVMSGHVYIGVLFSFLFLVANLLDQL